MRDLLAGERIRLTAVRETDMPALERWFNDGRFMRFYDMLPALPKQHSDVQQMISSFSGTEEKYIFAARNGKLKRSSAYWDLTTSSGAMAWLPCLSALGTINKPAKVLAGKRPVCSWISVSMS